MARDICYPVNLLNAKTCTYIPAELAGGIQGRRMSAVDYR